MVLTYLHVLDPEISIDNLSEHTMNPSHDELENNHS